MIWILLYDHQGIIIAVPTYACYQSSALIANEWAKTGIHQSLQISATFLFRRCCCCGCRCCCCYWSCCCYIQNGILKNRFLVGLFFFSVAAIEAGIVGSSNSDFKLNSNFDFNFPHFIWKNASLKFSFFSLFCSNRAVMNEWMNEWMDFSEAQLWNKLLQTSILKWSSPSFPNGWLKRNALQRWLAFFCHWQK